MANIINFRMRPGVPLPKQRGFANAINQIIDILNGVEGLGSVSIKKVGRDWRIVGESSGGGSGGIPDGYEERAVTLYCQGEKLDATILVKTSGLTSTAYGSGDARALLQVKPVTGESGTTYELHLDDGYLRDPGGA